MEQEAAAAGRRTAFLQPAIPKSDRLLGACIIPLAESKTVVAP
jgi:hypothetical protein